MMNALRFIPADSAGIARLEFNQPQASVNTLSESVMAELDNLLETEFVEASIKALLISSTKPGVFIAGADIAEIEKLGDEQDAFRKSQAGQAILTRLSRLGYPTIAVIDGVCLGGGLELALACTFRVVTDSPKTALGMPEVQLGILPGWGGTQRLPRLVGLVQALPMILSGKPVNGEKAARMGLADRLVPHEFADDEVLRFVQECMDPLSRRAISKRRKPHRLERIWPVRTIIINKAGRQARERTKGHYPAVEAIFAVMAETVVGGIERGLERESRAFAQLAMTSECRNLVGIFQSDRRLKKDAGVEGPVEVRSIHRAGVLGAGVMGGGIAWLFSAHGRPARMKDVSWAAIGKGFAEAADYYRQLVKLGKMKPHETTMGMHRITGALDYKGFGQADVIVEAIVENMETKKKVLQELESSVREDALICSNTSALSIGEMASVLTRPERFVGMHFFNPVNRMPLVEVVAGERSSKQAIASIVALVRELGKIPVVVRDRPGFLVNRILIPYLNEAGRLLEEGVDFERIDRLVEGFGMPMGPFVLADETGIDVGYKVILELEKAFSPRFQAVPVLQRFIDAGLLGKKAGGGFYLHHGRERSANPAAVELLAKYESREIDDEVIVDRLILTMLNEAILCLEEEVVERVDQLDMALVYGIGFPPFRGGLLRYADEVGTEEVERKLKGLRERYGDRFVPAKRLAEMARLGRTFY